MLQLSNDLQIILSVILRILQLVFVTWARVVCLICAPRGTRAAGPRAEGVHIR